jgi:hypothetical protein
MSEYDDNSYARIMEAFRDWCSERDLGFRQGMMDLVTSRIGPERVRAIIQEEKRNTARKAELNRRVVKTTVKKKHTKVVCHETGELMSVKQAAARAGVRLNTMYVSLERARGNHGKVSKGGLSFSYNTHA